MTSLEPAAPAGPRLAPRPPRPRLRVLRGSLPSESDATVHQNPIAGVPEPPRCSDEPLALQHARELPSAVLHVNAPLGGAERRARLASARLMLLFTPDAVAQGDPLAVLRAALPWVDAVQVRIKPPGGGAHEPPAAALDTYEWTLRVLALRAELASAALVLVNDRVDVALLLAERGADGVHLGQDDFPPAEARALLGPEAVIGLSTHDARQVARATLEPVDYLGFGPVWPSGTKGYASGLGSEAAWVAASVARPRPLFPIGGIDATNAAELAPVGRAAVSAAILGAADPAAAARALRQALDEREP